VLARVDPIADDMPLGTNSIEADGADPRPDDDAKGLCRDLVVHGASPSTPGFTAPGDAVPAPRFSSAVGPGMAGLCLMGSLARYPRL
jgi:hypothetical protein